MTETEIEMSIKCLPEASPGTESSKSNMVIAKTGSSTLKSHLFLNTLVKLWRFFFFFFKRETLGNFGYCHGEDKGQAMSRCRSLANFSPTFPGLLP